MNQQFQVNKNKFNEIKFVETKEPVLKKGQIRLEIEKFALTSNNITYAVVGETVGYWQFFPVKDSAYGIVPAWGFGRVSESLHDQVSINSKYYGFFPMSGLLTATPVKVRDSGFIDGSEHRENLPTVYNFYTDTAMDVTYLKEQENYQIIFRPLFVTSFLLDDFLEDNNFFNSDQVVLTSASSKTALGLAHLLSQRRKDNPSLQVVGLTSQKNEGFVKGLGCYDQVITYNSLGDLDKSKMSVIVDFSGNSDLLSELRDGLKKNFSFCSKVGMVHHEKYDAGLDLGDKARFFFAPSQVRKRHKEWGEIKFNQKLGSAWHTFIDLVKKKIEIEEINDMETFGRVYSDMVTGDVNPNKGYIVNYSKFT